MSLNRLALIRYKIIDECLANKARKWTLENLIEKVSEGLAEYEGIYEGISKRTIQLDLQMMRSDKLGYNAPIVVVDRKYYTYDEKDYSITKKNIGSKDLEKLADIVKLLHQFKGFTYFEDVEEMIGRLEGKILKQKNISRQYIDFEKNDLLKGLEWIDVLLNAIKNQQVLDIQYQSFKARTSSKIVISPYLLKEYRNRWFLLCKTQDWNAINIYALDRIQGVIQNHAGSYQVIDNEVINGFFDNVIGVTKTINQKTQKVVLKINKSGEPYVLTKPLHHSQRILQQDEQGTIFSLDVVLNFELEREILGFGEAIRVISPRILKQRIEKRIQKMQENYI